MADVRIEITRRGARVFSPYDEWRIATIKTIPGRTWHHSGKVKYWRIPTGQVDALTTALQAQGDRVLVVGAAHSDAERERRWAHERAQLCEQLETLRREVSYLGGCWADQLLARVEGTQRDRVYQALAGVLHPDAGGDAELMRQLDTARELRNLADCL